MMAKRRASINVSYSDSDSDSKYVPSSDGTSSEVSTAEDEISAGAVPDSQVDLSESMQVEEWHAFEGLQKAFSWTDVDSWQSIVPADKCRPIDFFSLFCDETVLQHMVAETHRYGNQVLPDYK
jgi:hypothetical protein